MFEDSLVESGGRLAHRNPWTTAFSFAVQMFAGGVLVLMSLIYTESLPSQKLLSVLEAPVPPPAAATAAPEPQPLTKARSQVSELSHGVLIPPSEVPRSIVVTRDEGPPSWRTPGIVGSIPDGIPVEPADNVTQILRSGPSGLPEPAIRKVRVSSGVAQGLLIRQVKPEYPALSRQARIQGTVMLQATIGKVQNLRVINGHPMLTATAIAAARQWLYRSYYLNGEPVEVETQINVVFTLTSD